MYNQHNDPWGEPDTETETAKTGLYLDISNEDYHAHPSISKSGLDRIDISPAHFMKSERKETPAFKKGTLIHCAILEPDYLFSRYFEMPEKPDLRTKVGKAMVENYTEMANGKVLVTKEEMHMAVRVRESVQSHAVASELFKDGYAEASVFSKLDCVDVRCRPDYINGSVVVDLKSTECARYSDFIKSVEKYRYFVQHPFYVDVMQQENMEVTQFVFVAIEKTEPYGIGVYVLDDATVELGRKAYQANLNTYKRCLESGQWPCYPEQVKSISLSKYARNQVERRIDESY
jgi:hypothetical protein